MYLRVNFESIDSGSLQKLIVVRWHNLFYYNDGKSDNTDISVWFKVAEKGYLKCRKEPGGDKNWFLEDSYFLREKVKLTITWTVLLDVKIDNYNEMLAKTELKNFLEYFIHVKNGAFIQRP